MPKIRLNSLTRALRGMAPCLVVLWLSIGPAIKAGAADPQPLKICLLSASAEYGSEESLSEFQKYLESHYQVVCARAFGKDKGNDLPGLESLENADLMVVFTRRVTLPPAHMALLKKYIASNRPIIGIRTASHAFADYMEFDKEILGGGYKGHYSNAVSQVFIAPGRSAHPILAGVTPFTSRKPYKNPTLADDDEVLLEASIPDHVEPVAWARDHAGRRIFYTSLGVQGDFKLDSFRRLLVNAIFWTTQRDEAANRRAPAARN